MNQAERKLLTRQINRANRLTTERLACRVGADRHHWVQCKPDIVARIGVPIVHQCEKCDTIKRVIFAPQTGEVLLRSYEYPADYLLRRSDIDGDEPLMSSAAVRVSMANRHRDLPDLRKERSDD